MQQSVFGSLLESANKQYKGLFFWGLTIALGGSFTTFQCAWAHTFVTFCFRGARGRERERERESHPSFAKTQPGARPHIPYRWFSKAPLLVPTSPLCLVNEYSNWNLVFCLSTNGVVLPRESGFFLQQMGSTTQTPLLTSKFNIILIWSAPMEKWWGGRG
jgi:hypothetical protein